MLYRDIPIYNQYSSNLAPCLASLNSTASLHRVLLVRWSKLSDSNSLVDTIPYSIYLMVSVDKYDKICLFSNIIFAVTLHFIKLTLIHIWYWWLRNVRSYGSSEVTHLTCVCTLSGMHYIFRCTLHYRWLSRLHWFTIVWIWGNHIRHVSILLSVNAVCYLNWLNHAFEDSWRYYHLHLMIEVGIGKCTGSPTAS